MTASDWIPLVPIIAGAAVAIVGSGVGIIGAVVGALTPAIATRLREKEARLARAQDARHAAVKAVLKAASTWEHVSADTKAVLQVRFAEAIHEVMLLTHPDESEMRKLLTDWADHEPHSTEYLLPWMAEWARSPDVPLRGVVSMHGGRIF